MCERLLANDDASSNSTNVKFIPNLFTEIVISARATALLCTPYPKSYGIVNTHTSKRSHHITYTCTTATTKFSKFLFYVCVKRIHVIAQHWNHTQNLTRSILWIWMGNSHISLQKCNMNLSFTPIRSISFRTIFFCIPVNHQPSARTQNEWINVHE